MPYLNMSSHNCEAKIKALHENLDHALSCLSGLQQPMMSTSLLTAEDEAEGNGSAFVFKV